jgi:hypothetical protein
MKALLLRAILGTITLHVRVDPLEGLWQRYDGEWGHVSRQPVALAEGIPAHNRLASGSGRAVHERSIHAHRARELLSVECHRAADASRD